MFGFQRDDDDDDDDNAACVGLLLPVVYSIYGTHTDTQMSFSLVSPPYTTYVCVLCLLPRPSYSLGFALPTEEGED